MASIFYPARTACVCAADLKEKKKISTGMNTPPTPKQYSSFVSESFGQPHIVYIITFLESIFFPKRNKKHMLCIVYNFLGFLGYCQTCIMRGHGAAEFPSYHKLACMAPLLSPQSSSNWCNWTSPLLSSKRRSSIAYAPNTLDNESHAAGQEGRLARRCSVNKFQSH